jgi:serine/threonine protein kinase/tetratricopeptide (TPR) repeat protein
MNPALNQIKSLFLEAVEGHAPDQWPAFLDRACAGQPELRRGVEALLQAHEEVGTAQHTARADERQSAARNPDRTWDSPGAIIGPYKLVEPIGEGGMGTVWMAQQQEPVKRLVALKLIKAGMDSRQVVARFEAERQALALMDHANIARVLDAGTSGAGRPYFVMDLVKGVPITRYCDENRLTPRQRLELFIPVCQAVQHAHQKGVIHRDLKPSNVLVALYDGRPVPKVIDFGVAKAAGQSLTEKTLVTGFGAIVGTLEYMSPEQAELNQLDVDTRSDIYSLGVLLYELLTGSPPFSRKELETVGLLETLRVIREQEPPRPSARLSTAGGLPALAANRGTEPARLARLVRGELDWIVLKALEKDRNRRYESAGAFAEDVRRYLQDQPVKACPPSRGYRFGKFARRNKAALAVGVLAGAMLVATVVTLSVSTLLIAEERNAAREAAREARSEAAKAERERRRADANFARARVVVDDVVTQVAGELAEVPRAEQIRRSLLNEALRFYKGVLREGVVDPAVRAETARSYLRVADIHRHLGEGSQSEKAGLEAVGLLEELTLECPGQAEYREDLAHCYGHLEARYQGTGRWQKALEVHHKTLALREGLVAAFPGVYQYRIVLASALALHGGMLQANGKRAEAEAAFRRAFRAHEQARIDFPKEPEGGAGLVQVHREYGRFLSQTARLPEAEKHLRQALRLYEALAAKSPLDYRWHWENVLLTRIELARVLEKAGRPAEAEKHLRALVGVLEKRAQEFPHTVSHQTQLAYQLEQWGLTLFGLNRAEEAERALRRCLEATAALHKEAGDANPEHAKGQAWAHYHLGELLRETGRPAEAAEQFRQARGLFEQNAARLPDIPRSHYHLAWALAACPDPELRDPARAVRHAERAVTQRPEAGVYWTCLGIAHYRAGQWQAAAEACEKALRLHPEPDGFEWFFLAMAQWRLGQRDPARQSFASGVKWVKQRPVLELELRSCRREAAALLGIDDEEVPPLGNKR